jgi:hypothetical protein
MEHHGDFGLMKSGHKEQETRVNAYDSAKIAEIVQQVLARLDASSQKEKALSASPSKDKQRTTSAAITEKIITSRTIQEQSELTSQIFVSATAIVTPAARDDARSRNIQIQHCVQLPDKQQPDQQQIRIIDYADPDRANAVTQQLAIRGITTGTSKIVLTETPAKEVHFQCSRNNEVAVMIGSFNDIQRFSDEITPTVWVLDMQRLTFSAVVNAAAQISKTRRVDR